MKGCDNRKDSRRNNQEQPQPQSPQHQKPQPQQQPVTVSQQSDDDSQSWMKYTDSLPPPPRPTSSSPFEHDEDYERPVKNDLATDSEDWRKYIMKGCDNRKDRRRNNQEQPQPQSPQHQKPQPQQQPVTASQQSDDDSQSWMKYTDRGVNSEEQRSASVGRSVSSSGRREGGQRKMFGRDPKTKSGMNEQMKSRSVKKMPFTDHLGDFGYYTGCVNDNGRPNGKGIMKYENGVFYEGTWMDGCQDKHTASRYERIQSGFTSWGGKGQGATKSGSTLPWNSRKNDVHDDRAKTFVRGMDWTDFNGHTGRYTGGINKDQLPHGTGIMKYDFGLIAQGDWVNGILNEGPHDRMISAAASMGASMTPGGSVGPGMSVGPGAFGYAGGAVSVLGEEECQWLLL